MKRSHFIAMVSAMAGLAVFAEPVKSVLGNDGIERSGVKPYKYRLEYIESTGTQWINTGVKFNRPSTFALSANLLPTYNEVDLFGFVCGGMDDFAVGVYQNFVFCFNRGATRVDSASLGSTRTDVDILVECESNYRTLTVNGISYTKAKTIFF